MGLRTDDVLNDFNTEAVCPYIFMEILRKRWKWLRDVTRIPPLIPVEG
jgi:hypothetical protein